jgi:hypothetical protein
MKKLGGLVIVVTAVASAAVAVATAGTGATVLTVRGTQTVVDEQKGRYEMHGSLVGAWNTTAFTLNYAGADGQVVVSGKETFAGCHDADRNGACDPGEPKGTLRFSFIYWAAYKPGTKTLVKGQCVHPVVGGTGAFAKAKGVLHMTDRPSKGGVLTTYTGTLAGPGISVSSATAPPERTVQSTSRAARGGCGS